MKNKIFLFLLFFFPFLLTAQVAPKYGKLSKEEKNILKTELDSNASAIILSDYGEIDFMGKEVSFLRHTRIKILNKNGFKKANISIPYLSSDENIIKIKAQTLEIDKKGKVKKTKVKKGNFYTVDLGNNIKEMRFTFPNVKPGSIIEYEFIKNSYNIFNLEEWKFRNDLPTLKSLLHVIIAKYLDYKIVYNGEKLIEKYGNSSRNVWELENLQPLMQEPFCLNPQDYIESVRFQLAGIKKEPNRRGEKETYNSVIPTWEQLALDILETREFENFLNPTNSAKKIVDKIISKNDSDREKIQKIYSFIQTQLTWNGEYQIFPEMNFSQMMASKFGSSANINLSLISLLRAAGLNANPLIISTKNNGLLTQVYPLVTQFNQLIAQVKLDGKDFLMNATSKFRPPHLLSKNDLNPLGFLLSKKEARWIVIEFPTQTKTSIITDLKISNKEMKYKTSFSFNEHHAVFYRKELENMKNEKLFILNHLLAEFEENDLELDSFKIFNQYEFEMPLNIICYFSKEFENEFPDKIFYITPFFKKHFDKTPFNNDTRFFPVDFILPSKETFIFNLFIPQGYETAELPKSSKVAIDNNKVNYSFLCKKLFPEKIQVISNFSIADPFILPKEYSQLKDLFTQMIGLQGTQLVLKKK